MQLMLTGDKVSALIGCRRYYRQTSQFLSRRRDNWCTVHNTVFVSNKVDNDAAMSYNKSHTTNLVINVIPRGQVVCHTM